MDHTVPRWTTEEEQAFADIQKVSRLTRIQAIHLWKRCRRDTAKAIQRAEQMYPPMTQTQKARLEKARVVLQERRAQGGTFQSETARAAILGETTQ